MRILQNLHKVFLANLIAKKVAQMSGRAGGAIHEMKMKSIALDLFFCLFKKWKGFMSNEKVLV